MVIIIIVVDLNIYFAPAWHLVFRFVDKDELNLLMAFVQTSSQKNEKFGRKKFQYVHLKGENSEAENIQKSWRNAFC